MIIGISGKIESGKDTVAKIIQCLTSKDKPEQIVNIITNNWFSKTQIEYDWKIKKFAGKLKQMVSLLTGISVEDLEKQEVKDRVLGEEWTRYGYADGHTRDENNRPIMTVKFCDKERYEIELRINWQTAYRKEMTVRELLQKLGTEALRDVIHQNVHVNALFADYKKIGNYEHPEWWIKEYPDKNPIEEIYPNWIISDLRFPNEAEAIRSRNGINIRIERPRIVSSDIPLSKETLSSINKLVEHPSETALDDYKGFKYKIINDGTIEQLVVKVKQILLSEGIV